MVAHQQEFRRLLGGADVPYTDEGIDIAIEWQLTGSRRQVVETASEHQGQVEAPKLMPLPDPPSPAKHLHSGKMEWLITGLGVLIFGPLLGLALATFSGLGSIQDILMLRSPVGVVVTAVIGPAVMLLLAEGYKYVVAEIIRNSIPSHRSGRAATIVLYLLLAGLIVLNLADAAATANLFRQAAEDLSPVMDGKLDGMPVAMFALLGAIVSGPLVITKIRIGRAAGMESCRVWREYEEKFQSVTEANRRAEQAHLEAIEAHRKRIAEKVEAEAVRVAKAVERNRQIAAIRKSNPDVISAIAEKEEIEKQQLALSQLEGSIAKSDHRIAELERSLFPSTLELADLARIDIATMKAMNDVYALMRGPAGPWFADDDIAAQHEIVAAYERSLSRSPELSVGSSSISLNEAAATAIA